MIVAGQQIAAHIALGIDEQTENQVGLLDDILGVHRPPLGVVRVMLALEEQADEKRLVDHGQSEQEQTLSQNRNASGFHIVR